MATIAYKYADPTTDGAVVSWGVASENDAGLGELFWGTQPNVYDLGYWVSDSAKPAFTNTIAFIAQGQTVHYKVSITNLDTGDVASATGSFVPAAVVSGAQLTKPDAYPRRVASGEDSYLSVMVLKQGAAVPNVVVQFSVVAGSQGSGELSSAAGAPGQSVKGQSDASGLAEVKFTGGNAGNVRVETSSGAAAGKPVVAVIVE